MSTLIFTVYWYMLVTAKTVTALARSSMQYTDAVAGWAVHQQGKRTVAVIGDPISAAGCHYEASIIMGIGVARVAKWVS